VVEEEEEAELPQSEPAVVVVNDLAAAAVLCLRPPVVADPRESRESRKPLSAAAAEAECGQWSFEQSRSCEWEQFFLPNTYTTRVCGCGEVVGVGGVCVCVFIH
jgi:hypothetical protein